MDHCSFTFFIFGRISELNQTVQSLRLTSASEKSLADSIQLKVRYTILLSSPIVNLIVLT